MPLLFLLALSLLLPFAAQADSLVATRVIRAKEIIMQDAVTLVDADIPGALTDPAAALGQEARVAIFPGRPILSEALGAPALIERNQVVAMQYQAGGLTIRTEGRALSRGGPGDWIDAMNLTSKARVTGRIGADGILYLGTSPSPQG